MNWFFIALGAPFLWALVNIADNYLVTKFSRKEEEKSSGALVLFSSLIGLVVAGFIWIFIPDIFVPSNLDKFLLFFSGVITIAWIILYLFSLEIKETSAIVPWFLSVPIFGYVLGYILLGETLTSGQLLGAGIILLGLVLMSVNFEPGKNKFKGKHVYYMFFACLGIAVADVIFKYVAISENFWVSSFWVYLGLGISGLLIFLFIPHYRESFLHMNRTSGHIIFMVNIVSEFMSVIGNLLSNYALLLAPVALVMLVGSFQPALVLILAILGTKFFPHIVKENISKKILVQKIAAIIIMIIGSTILFIY